VASLLADWSDPWLLVTVCNWMSEEPYDVIKYSPALPDRVPYVTVPDEFEGTWLERPGAKWHPGEPFPEEWLRESEEYVARQRAIAKKRSQAGESSPVTGRFDERQLLA
jgi:hypothetical protein